MTSVLHLKTFIMPPYASFHIAVELEGNNIRVETHNTEYGSAKEIKNIFFQDLPGSRYTLSKIDNKPCMTIYIPTPELQEHIIDIIRENPDTFKSYQIKGGEKIILNESEEEEEYHNHSSILTPNLNLTTQKEWEGIAKGWSNDSITTKDVLNTEVDDITTTSVVVNDTDTTVVNDTTKSDTTGFNSSTEITEEITEEIIHAYNEYVTEEEDHIKNQEIDNLKQQMADLCNHVMHLEHVMLATTEYFTQKITALESKNIDLFHKEEKSFKTEILTKLDMIMKHQSNSK